MDSNSPYDTENDRAVAEDVFIDFGGCVLNLAGLYGGEREVSQICYCGRTTDFVSNEERYLDPMPKQMGCPNLGLLSHISARSRCLILGCSKLTPEPAFKISKQKKML